MKNLIVFGLALCVMGSSELFAYDRGPAPQAPVVSSIVSGQTCAMSGCHAGNALNTAGGSISINGLPAEYRSGERYTLQVVISRTNSRAYGFQMSSVGATAKQAGAFSNVGTRTAVASTSGLSVIQHTMSGIRSTPLGTFDFTWTAPDESTGPVRINVAGNAANGDGTNLGDFIYTASAVVSPAAPSLPAPPEPSPPVIDTTTKAFLAPDLGGVSFQSDGASNLSVGYARIQSDSGSGVPAGVAIFGFRQGGVLVSEAGVPVSPLIQSGRTYAEVKGVINTGVAIANPGAIPATLTFTFTDSSGADIRSTTTTLAAGNQFAAFLDQPPFGVSSGFQGAMTFTSTAPVSVIALRGLTNERNEFLITTLPVADITLSSNQTIVAPHFADGGGWRTELLLVNPSESAIAGAVRFRNREGVAGDVIPYNVAARSSTKLITAGTGVATSTGSIAVEPATGVAPVPLAVFSFRSNGITVAEAGVPASGGARSRLFVQGTGAISQVGASQTGIAVANPSPSAIAVTLQLNRLDGSSTGLTRTIDLPGGGQTAKFLGELFPELPLPFQGVLSLVSTTSLAIVGLRGTTNERGDFLITTTPPFDEATSPTTELVFPHIVNGGGYSTQFILFTATPGQSPSGSLLFLKQDGSGLDLPVQ